MYEFIAVDEPAPKVRRITLNHPDRRNAISNVMRGELLDCLQQADGDDGVHVSIIRGAGPCFSSGYDLKSDLSANEPYFTSSVGMKWARHVSEGWMSLWDLAKPVIAQVHGYAMAGGLGLVGACALAYAAADAKLSHPVLRFALPDFAWFPVHLSPRHAMELHLTARVYSGEEAERILSYIFLYTVDEKWKDHLYDLDQLKAGIYFRAWGQKDPLVEYKKEAYEMFVALMGDIRTTLADRLFKAQMMPPQPMRAPRVTRISGPTLDTTDEGYAPGAAAAVARGAFAPTGVAASAQAGPPTGVSETAAAAAGVPAPARQPSALATNRGEGPAPAKPVSTGDKVGRNDPCPCGSGRKYKKCHGRPGSPPL